MHNPAKLREIVARTKRLRKPLPRWLWAWALAIGLLCAGAFGWMMLQEAGVPTTPARHDAGGPGFASGLAIGALAGFLIGWAVQRQRASHSSRNSP